MLKRIYHKFWVSDAKQTQKVNSKVDTPNVNSKKNIVYGLDGKNNLLDIHYPKDCVNKKLPTIFVIHGGGYVSGNKNDIDSYARLLADKGFCVVNVEYTKCDGKENKYFSDIIAEFYDMFDYVKNNPILNKHIDFNNIFLAGDSAGAHIASMVANIQTNPLLKSEFTEKEGPNVKGLIFASPLFGPYKFGGFAPLKNEFEDVVYGKHNKKELSTKCHAFDSLSYDFPPTVMFSAYNDFVVGAHKKAFLQKAKELNLSVRHFEIKKGYKLFHDAVVKYPDYYSNCLNEIKKFVNDIVQKKNIEQELNTIVEDNKKIINKQLDYLEM